MDIDFIKWLVDKADGFQFGSGCVLYRNIFDLRIENVESHITIYPLLLQRAIEGVNAKVFEDYNNDRRWVTQTSDVIQVSSDGPAWSMWGLQGEKLDGVKELVLKYIYEQEKL